MLNFTSNINFGLEIKTILQIIAWNIQGINNNFNI